MKVSLLDYAFAHSPSGSVSPGDYNWPCKHIQWERKDRIGDTIVITDGAIEDNLSELDNFNYHYKIGWLIEPRISFPDRYELLSREDVYNKFNMIMTYEKSMLSYSDKFVYYPYGGCWIDEKDRKLHNKTKDISIISSFKRDLPGHRLRHEVINAFHIFIDGIYGNGYRPVEHKITALKDYRYSIVIENNKTEDYFSEKLIDCFATGTIPIYYGAPGIGNYFNINGFYTFDNLEDLHKILTQCSEDDYNNKLDIIRENLDISKNYTHAEDWIYNEIFKKYGICNL
mgnify:CR=1 FL=1